MIRREGGWDVSGLIEALDGQEKMPAREGKDGDDGKTWESAIGPIRKEYGVPVGGYTGTGGLDPGDEGLREGGGCQGLGGVLGKG